MTTEMVTGKAIWRRQMRGSTYTLMVFAHPEGTVFELFSAGVGRVASLGRFESRAQALRAAVDGR